MKVYLLIIMGLSICPSVFAQTYFVNSINSDTSIFRLQNGQGILLQVEDIIEESDTLIFTALEQVVTLLSDSGGFNLKAERAQPEGDVYKGVVMDIIQENTPVIGFMGMGAITNIKKFMRASNTTRPKKFLIIERGEYEVSSDYYSLTGPNRRFYIDYISQGKRKSVELAEIPDKNIFLIKIDDFKGVNLSGFKFGYINYIDGGFDPFEFRPIFIKIGKVRKGIENTLRFYKDKKSKDEIIRIIADELNQRYGKPDFPNLKRLLEQQFDFKVD